MTPTLADKLLVLYRTLRPLEYAEAGGSAGLEWSQGILKQVTSHKSQVTVEEEFAEPNKDIASLYTEQAINATKPIFTKWLSQLEDTLFVGAENLESLRDRILAVYPLMQDADFAKILSEAMLAGYGVGRYQVLEEAKEDDVNFVEALEFAVPKVFATAIDKFRKKLPISASNWQDISKRYSAIATTVALITRLSMLADVKNIIEKQLGLGASLEAFKNQFFGAIAKAGWNPNSESPYRINLILSQNIKSAVSFGRWEQQEDLQFKSRYPYKIWQHGKSLEPRPMHIAQDGKVFLASDPVWKAISPQQPWGCKCVGKLMSDRRLLEEGLVVGVAPRLEDIAEPGFNGFPVTLEQQRLQLQSSARASLPPELGRLLKEDAPFSETLDFYDPKQPRDEYGRFARVGRGATKGVEQVFAQSLTDISNGYPTSVGKKQATDYLKNDIKASYNRYGEEFPKDIAVKTLRAKGSLMSLEDKATFSPKEFIGEGYKASESLILAGIDGADNKILAKQFVSDLGMEQEVGRIEQGRKKRRASDKSPITEQDPTADIHDFMKGLPIEDDGADSTIEINKLRKQYGKDFGRAYIKERLNINDASPQEYDLFEAGLDKVDWNSVNSELLKRRPVFSTKPKPKKTRKSKAIAEFASVEANDVSTDSNPTFSIIAISDLESIADIRRILSKYYTDGIDEITKTSVDFDNSIRGEFTDYINPELTKRFAFTITDEKASYWLLNPGLVEQADFTEEENLDFATTAKKCKKGIACGNSCISATKTCSSNITPVQKQVKQAVTSKIKAKSKEKQNTATPTNSISTTSSKTIIADNVISNNSRITAESLNTALSSIQSEGIGQRLEFFREFVNKNNIQANFWDESASEKKQIQQTASKLKDKSYASNPRYQDYVREGYDIEPPKNPELNSDYLSYGFKGLEGAEGYTSPIMKHVVVQTNSKDEKKRKLEKTFTVDGSKVVAAVSKSIDDAGYGGQSQRASLQAATIAGQIATDLDSKNLLVYIHEVGHQVHFSSGTVPRPKKTKNVSSYADLDDKEWFAESFTAWMVDAERYRKFDKKGADFIEEQVKLISTTIRLTKGTKP